MNVTRGMFNIGLVRMGNLIKDDRMDTRRVDGRENERENGHEILIARCVPDSNIKMYFMCKIQIGKARTKIIKK